MKRQGHNWGVHPNDKCTIRPQLDRFWKNNMFSKEEGRSPFSEADYFLCSIRVRETLNLRAMREVAVTSILKVAIELDHKSGVIVRIEK